MFEKTVNQTIYSADEIWRLYRRLNRMPAGNKYRELFKHLKSVVQRNQDALYDLIFSGQAKEYSDLYNLIWIGGHDGSCAREDNLRWHEFLDRVRQRQSELPLPIQLTLNWYRDVHGW